MPAASSAITAQGVAGAGVAVAGRIAFGGATGAEYTLSGSAMAPQREEELQHLLRRAGFGASDAEVSQFARRGLLSFSTAVAHLLAYQEQPDDVDDSIGAVGYVGITAAQGR